jgi:hypothetical protein
MAKQRAIVWVGCRQTWLLAMVDNFNRACGFCLTAGEQKDHRKICRYRLAIEYS